MTQQIMITGSNRGIGFALVERYLQAGGSHIFATCRQPQQAEALQRLQQAHPDHLTIVALDVNDATSIARCVDTIKAQTSHLDVLINNAGIFPTDDRELHIGTIEAQTLQNLLTTNSIAPVMVTQACYNLLQQSASARVVMISSIMGSIELSGNSGLGYRMSKAAVNMATKVFSTVLADQNVIVIAAHPGWVSTDMGGAQAPVKASETADGLYSLIEKLSPEDSGKFYSYTHETLPW